MHAPATLETHGMLTGRHVRRMKPGAIFINTGRRLTVDADALVRTLEEEWIAGAALDVPAAEPPWPDSRLLSITNVLVTAHVAPVSERIDPARKRLVGQELALVLTGRWPMSCLRPAVLATSGLRRWQPLSMARGPSA